MENNEENKLQENTEEGIFQEKGTADEPVSSMPEETAESAPKKSKLPPPFVILGLISLVAAVALALTNMVTKGPIATRAAAALQETYNAVMPAETYEEIAIPEEFSDVTSLYAAKNGDEIIGYCVTAVKSGYNGDVAVNLGVSTDGVVQACAIGDTNFAETPGFGARWQEEDNQKRLVGLDASNGGSFEALSGATVTSTAVLNAANDALRCVAIAVLGEVSAAGPLVSFGASASAETEANTEPAALTGAVQEASAKGFASDVTVQLTVDDIGTIAQLTIDAAGETAGLGQRAMESEFVNQFIGQTGPFTLGENIDALSGATITSQAAVNAVNSALSAPASGNSDALTGTAKGFASDVTVTLALENGAVVSFAVEASGETAGLGQRAMESEFTDQFIGKSAPFTLGENIDAVSGATITSQAAVDAANAAIVSADTGSSEDAGEVVEVVAESDDATLAVKQDGSASVTVKEGFSGETTVSLTVEDGKIVSGSFNAGDTAATEAPATPAAGEESIATAKGFGGDVTVKVTLDNGTVTALSVETPNETAGFGQKCSEEDFTAQFIGKTLPLTLGEDVDAVSGATITSTAVVDALNSLVK